MNKTDRKTESFECPKCNEIVKFVVEETHHFADESDVPIMNKLNGIVDYGRCQVAQNAKVPCHPTHFESMECPYYKKHFG